MSNSTAKQIFKWPLSLFVLSILFVEIFFYAIIRFTIKFIEWLNGRLKTDRRLRKRLSRASSYEEFSSIAKEMDSYHVRKKWIENEKSDFYNSEEISALYAELKKSQQNEDYRQIMRSLQVYFQKCRKEYEIEALYSNTYYYTKNIIHDLLRLIVTLTEEILETPKVSVEEKREFFEKVCHDNGETALCLSGGAKLCFFHNGVIIEMASSGLMPRIVSGTSGGAICAAFVAVRTDEELKTLENVAALFDGLWKMDFLRLIKNGYMIDFEKLKKKVKSICFGDMTFLEAFKKTGRILNITATKKLGVHDSVMLNYRTAPNVCIWSAVLASSALPRVLPAGELFAKHSDGTVCPYYGIGRLWFDGSYNSDVPLKNLREKFNVTYTIVSQTNPHVIPFAFENTGSSGDPPVHRSGVGMKGGFILSGIEIFLRIEMRKWIIVLQQLGIPPLFFGYDFSQVINQKFSGTVTVYANASILNYLKLFREAKISDIKRLEGEGRRAFWPKKRMISDRLFLENSLKKAHEKLF